MDTKVQITRHERATPNVRGVVELVAPLQVGQELTFNCDANVVEGNSGKPVITAKVQAIRLEEGKAVIDLFMRLYTDYNGKNDGGDGGGGSDQPGPPPLGISAVDGIGLREKVG